MSWSHGVIICLGSTKPRLPVQCLSIDRSLFPMILRTQLLSQYSLDFVNFRHKDLSRLDDFISGGAFSITGTLWKIIHQSSVNSLRKGQRCGTLMFPLFFAWTHFRENCRVSSGLRRHYSSRLAGSIDLKHRANPARWPSGFYLASRRSSFRNEMMANIWHLLPCVCWECIW